MMSKKYELKFHYFAILFNHEPMRLSILLLLPILQAFLLFNPTGLNAQTDSGDDTLTVSGVWLLKGLQSHNREKYDSALYWYDKIASFDTNYSTALYEKALSNFKLEKYDNTLLLCSKADSMNKSDEILYKNLMARAHQKKGNISEAYKINYGLKKKYPYYAGLYTEKAHLAMEESDWNQALIQLDSAFKLNPQFHTTHLYFSELAYLSGQPALGILAAHYGSLSLSNASDQLQLVQILNLEADDNYKSDYKVPENLLGEFPEMDEINQLVKSKVCYTKNYKLKLKLDEKYIRQLQIIIENLATTELNQHDSLSNYYLDFYKIVATNNMFEGCVLYGLDAIKAAPAVANLLMIKRSNIEYFSKWLNGEVQKMIGR
ncbi:MAG: CDC27 family protein, partial [Bacteroidetes bacterium]|nr:CDC27 family protein [Bacteroidota bacterium]